MKNIQPVHGHMVLGVKEDGQAYSVYDEYEDPNRGQYADRVVLHFGRDETGQSVVSKIERDGAAIMPIIKAARASGLPRDAEHQMIESLTTPQKATIMGLEFEVGEAASGKVVDADKVRQPDVQKALADAEQNYYAATLSRVPLARTDPQLDMDIHRDR